MMAHKSHANCFHAARLGGMDADGGDFDNQATGGVHVQEEPLRLQKAPERQATHRSPPPVIN